MERRVLQVVKIKKPFSSGQLSMPIGYPSLTNTVYAARAKSTQNLRPITLQQQLCIPVSDQAPCYFISSFVLQPKHEQAKGYFDYLIPLLNTARPASTLTLAFEAVAYAAMANRPSTRSSNLMSKALMQYHKALKATNHALRTPSLQKLDTTLASVLLLGHFEVRCNLWI